jgi:hypothetical protein
VIPIAPELLLRMEGTPFVIEVWHKHESACLQGIVKVDLRRLPRLLLTKDRTVDESAGCLHDVHPVMLHNGLANVSTLAQQPRGQLYIALSFGTIQQIQRMMEGLPSIPAAIPSTNIHKENSDTNYKQF